MSSRLFRADPGAAARTGKPRRRRIYIGCRPGVVRLPRALAQTRDQLAVQRDRGAIGGGRVIANRAEMAPKGERKRPPGSSTASPQPAAFDRRWRSRTRVARKGRRNPLKQRNPRPKMARSACARAVRQRARRKVSALLIPARREDADGGQAGRRRPEHYASFRLLPKPKHECSCTSMRFQF